MSFIRLQLWKLVSKLRKKALLWNFHQIDYFWLIVNWIKLFANLFTVVIVFLIHSRSQYDLTYVSVLVVYPVLSHWRCALIRVTCIEYMYMYTYYISLFRYVFTVNTNWKIACLYRYVFTVNWKVACLSCYLDNGKDTGGNFSFIITPPKNNFQLCWLTKLINIAFSFKWTIKINFFSKMSLNTVIWPFLWKMPV